MCRSASDRARWRSGPTRSVWRCILGLSSLGSASSYPGQWEGLPRGDDWPPRQAVAVQVPVGEVERRSLEVYELAAARGVL